VVAAVFVGSGETDRGARLSGRLGLHRLLLQIGGTNIAS
jgi:hypothetical protein